jgi:8-oxo-dGTP pyrophosphatase MutT (NUDIX family)
VKKLEHFEQKQGYAVFCPVGQASFDEMADLISRAVLRCRQKKIEKLLIDSTGVSGLQPPGMAERYNFAERIAALRELLEETGYAAGRVEPVMAGASCSGITSERVTIFRAFDLHRKGKGGGIAHEDITVHEIPLAEVVKWLEAKATTGVLIDPKIYAGLFFVAQNK